MSLKQVKQLNNMIYIGSDHAGYDLKEKLKKYIEEELNLAVDDKGAFTLNGTDDYPDFIKPVAEAVSKDTNNLGIIIGASGEGEAICANKTHGIRAIVYYGGNKKQKDASGKRINIIESGRLHNNANILSLGARFITERRAKKTVRSFIETPFSNDERHIRRINKLEN